MLCVNGNIYILGVIGSSHMFLCVCIAWEMWARWRSPVWKKKSPVCSRQIFVQRSCDSNNSLHICIKVLFDNSYYSKSFAWIFSCTLTLKNLADWTSLGVLWLRLWAPSARGMNSTPGLGSPLMLQGLAKQTNRNLPRLTARLRIPNSPKIHSQGVRARTQPTFTATVRPCSRLWGLCQYPATPHRFRSSDLTHYRPFLRVHLTSHDKMLEVYLESIPWIKIQGFGDIRTCAKLLCFLVGVLYF